MNRAFLGTVAATMIVAAMSLAIGGCASNSKADGSKAMMCAKCETVWVAEPGRHGAGRAVYKSKSVMTCPMCEKMAEAYFSDGQVVPHNCPDCKFTPTVLSSGPAASKKHGAH